ncbi:Non-canonical poly(A) RNA polymerase PAPD5 [Mycena sanguinolenta]|uniref:polynucleotide adenylyltransferase n=1 Tax=Mycena sanguinolenta TaxID=230812 RepID=A0A8H6XID5_9AGAR|nr:Non-canonical poly(A) RNA polymerase PAPD5 [Mycena sanguinolenta]
MDQTRESRSMEKPEKAPESSLLSRIDTNGLLPKPPRQKRKRSPAPVLPENQHVLTPWLAEMLQNTVPISTDQRLHQEIVPYISYVQPTPQENIARQALREVIQKALRHRFPDGEVKVFGSQATGLCLPHWNRDMDLVVMTREVIPAAEKKRPLFQLSTILKAKRVTTDVRVNHRARVPIITFTSLPEFGSFNVDLGINNTDGPQAIAVVNEYLSKMPALRPLILIVKGFLSQRNLNSAAYGGLGSYAVICMCISFLQLNPSKRPQDYIDKPMETESLGALLADFMFYYGIEFPYAASYICVSEGKLLPKESAKWITNKVPDGLAIQCPVNPGEDDYVTENDVGKAVNRLDAIRDAFKTGYTTILRLSLANTSLLRPLVSLTQSTLDHRAHIKDIVDSGKLQDAVSPPPRHPRTHNKPAHKSVPQLTHTPPLSLPRRQPPPPSRPVPPPQYVPYGMGFGAGSVMGRNAYSSRDSGSINRKGSGFASGMHSSEPLYLPEPQLPAPHPHFDSEWPPRGRGSKTTRRSKTQSKRQRIDGGS